MAKTKKKAEPLDLQYFIWLFLRNWKFICIVLFLSLLLASLVNTFSKKVYSVNGSIVIDEEANGFSQTSASILSEFGVSQGSKNFANEILVLKSTPLLKRSLEKLNFQISYYELRRFVKKELYKGSPFVVIINNKVSQPIETEFSVEIIDNLTFKLNARKRDVECYNFYSNQITDIVSYIKVNTIENFDTNIIAEYYDFKIILNKSYDFSEEVNRKFSFKIHKPKDIIKKYQRQIGVLPIDLESSVAELTINTPTPQKGVDFINSLLSTYLEMDQERKNYISVKTIEYINNQLNTVKDSLKIAEENLQRFRSKNRVVDISLQAGQVFDESRQMENEKASHLVNMKYYEYLENYFKSNDEYSDLITPAGMGIQDPLLNNLISELISLNSEKVTFIENKQEKSPYLKKIEIRIENIKNMIYENISYAKNTASIALSDINSRINQLNAEITKLPQTERELLGMERKYNINDEIYTFLLQKQAEAEITKASNQPDAEILEPADIVSVVSPKKNMNYILAFLISMIFSVSTLRFRDIIRNKFIDKNEIKRLIDIPVIGQIFHNDKRIEPVVTGFPKSHITESFRKLRTNLSYFLPGKESKIIVVTSTIGQEGKSFISLNIALTLALNKKKTILIGFDLRKPRIYERLEMKENAGLSDYLSSQSEYEDIIQPSKQYNIDCIWAGKIPPNPSELIASDKTDQLIARLKKDYEYIIINTAPIGLVADSHILLEKADLKIFVIRTNFTLKKETIEAISDLKDKKIKNLTLVINDLPLHKRSGYGYGYYEDDLKQK